MAPKTVEGSIGLPSKQWERNVHVVPMGATVPSAKYQAILQAISQDNC